MLRTPWFLTSLCGHEKLRFYQFVLCLDKRTHVSDYMFNQAAACPASIDCIALDNIKKTEKKTLKSCLSYYPIISI